MAGEGEVEKGSQRSKELVQSSRQSIGTVSMCLSILAQDSRTLAIVDTETKVPALNLTESYSSQKVDRLLLIGTNDSLHPRLRVLLPHNEHDAGIFQSHLTDDVA